MRTLVVSAMAVLVLAVCTFAAGCTATSPPKVEVVTSIFPLFDAARFVGGSEFKVTNILPLDPFGPLSVEKAEKLRTAKLAIVLGQGTQPEVERIASERTGPTVYVLEDVATKPSLSAEQIDPHVWLDPQNMSKIVIIVERALKSLEPTHEKLITKNAAKTLRSVDFLDRRFAATIATCDRRVFVTRRPDYRYLAERFGLLQVPAFSDDEMRAAMAEHRPSVVYFDYLPDLQKTQNFRREFGAKIATLDPVAVQTDQARRGGANYWTVMGINLAALRNGLDCDEVKVKAKL